MIDNLNKYSKQRKITFDNIFANKDGFKSTRKAVSGKNVKSASNSRQFSPRMFKKEKSPNNVHSHYKPN